MTQAGRDERIMMVMLALVSALMVIGLIRRHHRLAVPATAAATVALGVLAAFRLWRFGVVGLGDLAVTTLLAVLLIRNRAQAVAASV